MVKVHEINTWECWPQTQSGSAINKTFLLMYSEGVKHGRMTARMLWLCERHWLSPILSLPFLYLA